MYPYAIIYVVSALFSILTRSRALNRLLAALFTIVLVVFVGTRYDVGCDFWSYAQRYATLDTSKSWGTVISESEPGFYILTDIVQSLGGTFSTMLFVCALIYLACLFRFSRVVERPLGFLTLCFPVLIIQLGMSGVRQALATGFLLMAFAAFVRLQRLQFVIWVLFAMQFHTSAIAFLPIVYLIGRPVSIPRMVTALVLVGPVVAWFMGDRMDVYNDRYVGREYSENMSIGAWPRYAMVLLPFLLFEWKKRYVEFAYPKLFPLLRLFSLISYSLVVIGVLNSTALHRMVFYVMPVSLVAFIVVARSMKVSRHAQFYLLLPFLMYGAYFAGWSNLSRHADACYAPYQSWLFMPSASGH